MLEGILTALVDLVGSEPAGVYRPDAGRIGHQRRDRLAGLARNLSVLSRYPSLGPRDTVRDVARACGDLGADERVPHDVALRALHVAQAAERVLADLGPAPAREPVEALAWL